LLQNSAFLIKRTNLCEYDGDGERGIKKARSSSERITRKQVDWIEAKVIKSNCFSAAAKYEYASLLKEDREGEWNGMGRL
jgi:hypothetical protein